MIIQEQNDYQEIYIAKSPTTTTVSKLSAQLSAVENTLSQMKDVSIQLEKSLSSDNQFNILNSSNIGKSTLKVCFAFVLFLLFFNSFFFYFLAQQQLYFPFKDV